MPISLKRTLLPLALAAAALATSAHADTYPSRQITIMPLLAAGTGLDVMVRLYADQLSQSFGKPVVVENKPGSAGLVGIAALKAAPPMAIRLIVATSAVMAIRPTLLKTDALRRAEGFHPDRALCEVAVHPGGRSEAADPFGPGPDQIRQGTARASSAIRRRASAARRTSPPNT